MKQTFAAILIITILLSVGVGCTDQASSLTSSHEPSVPQATSSSVMSEPACSSATNEALPYEVQSITQQCYENGVSYIQFNDLPENDTETIICNSYLAEITGERQKDYALWIHGPEETPPTEENEAEYEVVYEWIHINNVQELTLEETMQREEYPELFSHWHDVVGSSLSYDAYVEAVFASGCRMVLVEDENKFFDYIYERGPQLSDGEHSILWLLGPDDADGELKIFQNTRFFWSLFLTRDASAWPSFVIH